MKQSHEDRNERSGREANALTRTRSGRAVRRGPSSRSGRLLDACGVRVGERRAGHVAVGARVRVVPVARVLRHFYLLRRLRGRALLRTRGTRRRSRRRRAARVRSRRGGDGNLSRSRSRRRGHSSAGQLRQRCWTLLLVLHLLVLLLWRTLHLLHLRPLLRAGRRRRGAHVLDVLQVLLLELLVLLVLELLILVLVAARLLLTRPYRYAVRGRPGRPIACASRRRACQRCSWRSLLLAL